MNPARRNALVALGLMGAAATGAVAWKPTKHLSDTRPKIDLETLFPKQFGEWAQDTRVPVRLVSPDQAAVLNAIYNQTLSRTYTNPKGEGIMLSVAYGGDQSDATRAHRPEVCYPAQGFQIIISQQGVVATATHSLRVRQLVAKAGARIEPISYWVMVGDNVVISGTEQKLAQLRYTTGGVVPDGMLVRVSNISIDAPAAFALHQRFVIQMFNAVETARRQQVFGTSA